MKKLFLLPVLFLAACNSNTGNEEKIVPVKDSLKEVAIAEKTIPDLTGCYMLAMSKDTAHLQLQMSGNEVSGTLHYARFEKDSNKGVIKGKLQDSLIVADYTFQSEGVKSVRQIVFKYKEGKLIEGFGEVEMKGDTAKFKKLSSLKFLRAMPFVKVECQ